MTGHFDRNGTGEWHIHDEKEACPIGPEPKEHAATDVYVLSDGTTHRCNTCHREVVRFVDSSLWRHLP